MSESGTSGSASSGSASSGSPSSGFDIPAAVPPAWYPDPMDQTRLRWWDGNEWTSNLAPVGVPPQTETVHPAPSQWAVNYLPMSDKLSFDASGEIVQKLLKQPHTVWLWLLALLPLGHFAAIWLIAFVFAIHLSAPEGYALYLAPLLLYPLLAIPDSRVLRDRGYDNVPSPVLGLIPPLYLIVRAVRIHGATMVPAVIWTALQVLAIGTLLTQISGFNGSILTPPGMGAPVAGMTPPFSPTQRAYLLTEKGMEQKITYDYENPGAGVSGLPVSGTKCVPLNSTNPTSQTTCTTKIAGQKFTLTVIVVDSSTGTPFYIANQSLGG